jgi:chromosome segregation ATPase
MDRNALKIQALREKISEIVSQNEDKIADLRVELTVVSQDNAEKDAKIANLEEELRELRERSAETEEADDYPGADAD